VGIQRQEGTGAGDGVRLRERKKALKGEPQERIRSENGRQARGGVEASGGWENLETQGLGKVSPGGRYAVRGYAVGEGTSGEEPRSSGDRATWLRLLGARTDSEGAPKPTRGCCVFFIEHVAFSGSRKPWSSVPWGLRA
jgi:hypothetical protein